MIGIPGKRKKLAKLAFALAGIVLFMFFSLAVGVVWLWEPEHPFQEFMSTEEVCQRWGRHPLDTEKFKAAGRNNEAVRAEMACSLLENQDEYLGKSPTRIVDIFGDPDGYYASESHPAYFVNRARNDVWQVVFLAGRGEVSEIFIHKNCC